MKITFLFGFFFSSLIAFSAAITQQEVLAWAGTIAAAVSLVVMSAIPWYGKIREAILKAEIASREARKSDCEYALQCAKELINDLTRRIATLERESIEWQKLYQAGSRDYPKLDK